MNNSSTRFYTLASCGGLLALTACGSQEATTPPAEPTQSANTPPPKINLRSQSVIPLPRVASRPELSPTALVRSRAIALSGGESPFSDQEIQARLQQARLKREQLAKARLAQLQAQRSPVVTSTVTSLPQRPINLTPSLPKPLIPTPPPAPTLAGLATSTAAYQVPARTVNPGVDVHGTVLDATSLSLTSVASPSPSLACPGLVQPGPIQIDMETGKTVAPTLGDATVPTTDQLTISLAQSPDSSMDKTLAASHHQSYSAARGTFPCLTATRLPSQAMRLHSQVLNQNPQESTQGSSLPLQGRIGGESLLSLVGFRPLSLNQGQATDKLSQSPLTSPETTRYAPGFSSESRAD
jgi:hypothetical protein